MDVEQHDNQLDSFVSGLLNLFQQQAEDTERADFRSAAHASLNRAYGDDEPDYSDVLHNPKTLLTRQEGDIVSIKQSDRAYKPRPAFFSYRTDVRAL
ncbi:hypothetical protein [Spirosoma areae]